MDFSQPNTFVNYRTLRTEKVIRYSELDSGFILRANPEVTTILRNIIKKENQSTSSPSSLELINYCSKRKLYGVKLDDTIYLATLVNLPCIIEAMKTLDNFNFYKS